MNRITKCVLNYMAEINVDIDGVSCILDDDGSYYISIISYKHKLKNTAIISPKKLSYCRSEEEFIKGILDSLIAQYSKELSNQLKKKAASEEA